MKIEVSKHMPEGWCNLMQGGTHVLLLKLDEDPPEDLVFDGVMMSPADAARVPNV